MEAEWRKRAAGVVPAKPKARPAGQRHRTLGKGNAYALVGRASSGAAKRMSADTPTNPPLIERAHLEMPDPRFAARKPFRHAIGDMGKGNRKFFFRRIGAH
jgi:hypothetical protein